MTTPSINRSQQSAALPRPQAKIVLDHDDPLTKQTEKWVAQTFFGTLLRQARQSPFHSDMFDGGRGGKAFGEMLDQKLSEHMTHGAGSKLVHSLIRRFQANGAYKRQSTKSLQPVMGALLGGSVEKKK